MNLRNFKKKNKQKKKSKLFDFKNEILELIKDDYSQETICKFLRENGVRTKQSNLSQFISKLKKEKKSEKGTLILKKEIPKIEEGKKEINQNIQSEPKTKKVLFKTSNVEKFEIIEPDYSKFK